MARVPEYGSPCVKVSFPLPLGSSVVFLRPQAEADGSFKLISAERKFGDPGFYRLVRAGGRRRKNQWHVRYIGTLREFFHVYVDEENTLRTDHLVRFLGFTILQLHYKMTRAPAISSANNA